MVRVLADVMVNPGLFWAVIGVVVACGIALLGATWRLGTYTGKLETTIARLIENTVDHEKRIRVLENGSSPAVRAKEWRHPAPKGNPKLR